MLSRLNAEVAVRVSRRTDAFLGSGVRPLGNLPRPRGRSLQNTIGRIAGPSRGWQRRRERREQDQHGDEVPRQHDLTPSEPKKLHFLPSAVSDEERQRCRQQKAVWRSWAEFLAR